MPAPATRDYFAEMYVAGLMADAGWNIYFPRRDKGFDFIATIDDDAGTLVRSVQVKGFYPTRDKTDKSVYGYGGRLTQLHCDMILALVYFPLGGLTGAPAQIAYMPRTQIRARSRGGFRCVPCSIVARTVVQRREFASFFNADGLRSVASRKWG
jgi:hypothetical protein